MSGRTLMILGLAAVGTIAHADGARVECFAASAVDASGAVASTAGARVFECEPEGAGSYGYTAVPKNCSAQREYRIGTIADDVRCRVVDAASRVIVSFAGLSTRPTPAPRTGEAPASAPEPYRLSERECNQLLTDLGSVFDVIQSTEGADASVSQLTQGIDAERRAGLSHRLGEAFYVGSNRVADHLFCAPRFVVARGFFGPKVKQTVGRDGDPEYLRIIALGGPELPNRRFRLELWTESGGADKRTLELSDQGFTTRGGQ